MISLVVSWMTEITLLLGFVIWLRSRHLSQVMTLSIFLICSNGLAYYSALQMPGYFVTKSIILSALYPLDFYYWDKLTAVMAGLNLFATILIASYQLYNMREDAGEQVGLLWMTFASVQGVFCAMHAILFYMFFELSIIPLCLWILHYPTQTAANITRQFVIYTCSGATFFLIGLVICYMHLEQPSWLFDSLAQANVPSALTAFLSFCFIFPFLIKLPVWPVHSWLPLAHTQAPTEGSVILASVVLKIGGYSLLRLIPLMGKNIAAIWSPLLIVLGIISLVFMSLSAYQQADWKRLIAYSSIVHMAWVVMGIGLLIGESQKADTIYQGIVFQMVSHGLISMGLFLIVGMLSHRTNTRDITAYQGMVKQLPAFSQYITIFMLANSALPGTAGFIGEFLILEGLYAYSPIAAGLACSSLVLTIAYNLQYFIPLLLQTPQFDRRYHNVADCQPIEHAILGLLTVLTVYLGVFPMHFFSFFSIFP